MPWKHQRTRRFLMISGGIEEKQCSEMGSCLSGKMIVLLVVSYSAISAEENDTNH